MTKTSAKDLFFFSVFKKTFTADVFLQVSIYYIYTSAIKLNSQTTEKASWMKKKRKKENQPASYSSIRNICLPAEKSEIMCNHFCAKLRKLPGSVKCKTA